MRVNIRLLIVLVLISLFVSACENTVSHTSVTLDSNAVYAVYRKSPSDEYRVIAHNNNRYSLKTVTFTVEKKTSPYTMLFVCPSNRGNNPHEIYIYYATAEEMNIVDFKCRRADEDIIEKPVYGKVSGVSVANSQDNIGEIARVALSNEVSLDAHEAYALIVKSGQRDAVAYKGKQSVSGLVVDKPETFYIERGKALALTTDPQVIDVDFNGGEIGVYVSEFGSEPSSVTVQGLNEGERLTSTLGFLSEKKTYLELKASEAQSFSFTEVPLTVADEDVKLEESNFHPGEGHELIVTAHDSNDDEARKYTEIFTVSKDKIHNIALPSTMSNSPAATLINLGDLQEIIVSWNSYLNSGFTTGLYRWQFEGLAAPHQEGEAPDIEVNNVKWVVYVTPGWLKQIGGTKNSYALKLPTDFELNLKDDVGDPIYAWRKEWAFRASTVVNWELSAFSMSEEARANDIVEYLLNRKFDKSFSFTQANIRNSIQP